MITATCNIFILMHCMITECVVAGYRDCKQWLDMGYTESGIYPVNPDGASGEPFQVSNYINISLYTAGIGIL